AGCEHELGAVGLEQVAPLNAHGVEHDQDHLVPFGRRGKGQGDAGVAAGGLDDDGVFVELALALGGFNHCKADTIFDAASGVEVLELAINLSARLVRDAIETQQRCVADEVRDGSCDFPQNGSTSSLMYDKPIGIFIFSPYIITRDAA